MSYEYPSDLELCMEPNARGGRINRSHMSSYFVTHKKAIPITVSCKKNPNYSSYRATVRKSVKTVPVSRHGVRVSSSRAALLINDPLFRDGIRRLTAGLPKFWAHWKTDSPERPSLSDVT